MIASGITKQIGEALKAHDETRLSTLRMLSSALNYEKIAKQHDLSEEEELTVVRKESKKRLDAIEAMHLAQGKSTTSSEASLKEKLEEEEKELIILKEYLPPELPDSDLEKMVVDAISQTDAKSISDMGKVMGAVMAKAKGAADGKKVAELVKGKLATT